MTNELQAYLDAVRRCLAQCSDMRTRELEKRDAILHGQAELLGKIVAQEQADMMRLDSLESARIETQHAAGFADMTAEEILKAMPESADKQTIQPVIRELCATVAEVQKLNRESMELARQELMIFGDNSPLQATDSSPTYHRGQKKTSEWTPRRSFEEKI